MPGETKESEKNAPGNKELEPGRYEEVYWEENSVDENLCAAERKEEEGRARKPNKKIQPARINGGSVPMRIHGRGL